MGAPLLDWFTVDELRAGIAHELGHFGGADTRLNTFSVQAQALFCSVLQSVARDPFKVGTRHVAVETGFQLAQALGQILVRGYSKLFLYLTLPFGRRQELAADALSAELVGAGAAQSALEKVSIDPPLYAIYLQHEVGFAMMRGAFPTVGYSACEPKSPRMKRESGMFWFVEVSRSAMQRRTGSLRHLAVAALLGVTACDCGRTTAVDEGPGGDGAGGVPAQVCDKLPNAAIERGVIQASPDGSYSGERLAEISELFVLGASSLDGIECLPHLTKLWLGDGSLEDVSALSALQELETLTITNQQLHDLSSLLSLPKVQHLDIAQNQITDLATLPALPALTEIYVSLNPISSLAPLSAFPDLQVVWATGARLQTLDGLSLPELVELHTDDNQLAELGDLSQMPALQILDVNQNQLKDLRGVGALSHVTRLAAAKNPLESLDDVAALATLESLDVSDTRVRDLAPLAALSPLQYLGLNDTRVTSLAPLGGWTEGEGDCRKLNVTNVSLDAASNDLLDQGFCAKNWGVIPTCAEQCFDLR